MALAKYNGFVGGDTLPAENANSINPDSLDPANDGFRIARVKSDGKLPQGIMQMTDAQATALINMSDAKSLHHHLSVILQATRARNGSSGAVNYAHGLGRVPKFMKVTAMLASDQTCISNGTFDGTNQKVSWAGRSVSGTGNETNKVVAIEHNTGSGDTFAQRATVAWDNTNITLTWTYSGSASSATPNIVLMFEVY